MRDCGLLKRAQKGRETCPFRAPNGFNEIRLSALERMAGTTRLELATSAVTVNCWHMQNQSVRRAVVGNRWAYRDTLARFCATICATRMTISACTYLSHTPLSRIAPWLR